MKLKPSNELVKASLSSHSWMGILVGVLMYWVCLSGTLAVFYHEFERWEQPEIPEYRDYDLAKLEQSVRQVARQQRDTEHLFLLLPKASNPRIKITTDNGGWFVNPDGSLGEVISHPWTDLVTDLHLYLHLPKTWGMVLVSALGAVLCGLIVSGFMAHPRIFKDAFRLRLKGAARLEQADLHNRLSVWGAPFHLMIAVTGAFFGLSMLISMAIAQAFFEGDQQAVIEAIYGDEPELIQPIEPLGVAKALATTERMAPGSRPLFVTIEHPNTPEQFMIVGAQYPDRLIYAEQFRFDGSGEFLSKVGFADGPVGRQAIFSVYRLHFGHFGGFGVKLLYGIFGLALTAISVTGINIWLAKRKQRDYLNNLWVGLVWGTPLAFALSAVSQVVFQLASLGIFWAAVLAAMALAQWRDNDAQARSWLQAGCAAMLVFLVAAYGVKFGSAALAGVALGVNAALFATAVVLAGLAIPRPRQSGTHNDR